MEHIAGGHFFRLLIKPVIILHSSSRSLSRSFLVFLSTNPRRSNTMIMLAFSNVERRAMLRNCPNSLLEKDPGPFYPVK